MVVALFDRIIDIHNFECVLETLTPVEVACVQCRLGMLNLYNPCKPEGSWELDLSRREERLIVKTLCVLATHEPGDNWTYNTFRWQRDMDSMPGWELTQPWLTEEGLPIRGILNVTYYSGEGVGKSGCKPYVSFRKSLLNLVCIFFSNTATFYLYTILTENNRYLLTKKKLRMRIIVSLVH